MARRSRMDDVLADEVYPVRLRVHIPHDTGLQHRVAQIDRWLDENVGRGRFWQHSFYAPGRQHALLVFLPNAELADRFVRELDCAHLVKCEMRAGLAYRPHVYTGEEE
jgi:hypothetical protein